MELLEENASMLSASPLLYVSCLDFDSQSFVKSSNLACCRFSTVMGHVSFPKELRERRICLFVKTDKLKDLEIKISPAVIKVKSSCIHKLEDDEDEDKGRDVVLIFDFEILINQTSIATNLPPYDDYKGNNNIPEMPWLDISLTNCNCSRFPNAGKVAVQSGSHLPASEIQSDESDKASEDELTDSEEDESDEDEGAAAAAAAVDAVEDETLYSEYFKLKGSTYYDHFQKALRQCKRLLLDNTDVPVQMIIEPANVADENAIIVQAELDGKWHPVGYIPGIKVKKAMDALDKGELTSMKFKSIEWKYIYSICEFRYVSAIVASKRNRWLPSDKNYQYNAIL